MAQQEKKKKEKKMQEPLHSLAPHITIVLVLVWIFSFETGSHYASLAG